VTRGHFLVDGNVRISTMRAMAPSYTLASDDVLRDARDEVIQWLRHPKRFPGFLSGIANGDLARHHAEIAHEIRAWLDQTDFRLKIVTLGEHGTPPFEGQWTHRGADFVGFKQPDPASTVDDAVILACAALLRNEWCRARLPSP
jgi:hypothetical protein